MTDLGKMSKGPFHVQMGNCGTMGALMGARGVVFMLGIIARLNQTDIQAATLLPDFVAFYLKNDERVKHFDSCVECQASRHTLWEPCDIYTQLETATDALRRVIEEKVLRGSLPIGVPGNVTAALPWIGDDSNAAFESALTQEHYVIDKTPDGTPEGEFLLTYTNQGPLAEGSEYEDYFPSMDAAKQHAADEYQYSLEQIVVAFQDERSRVNGGSA